MPYPLCVDENLRPSQLLPILHSLPQPSLHPFSNDIPLQLSHGIGGIGWNYLITVGEPIEGVDLHDGNPSTKLESVDDSTLAWAFIEWENGETSAVDLEMTWRKVDGSFPRGCRGPAAFV